MADDLDSQATDDVGDDARSATSPQAKQSREQRDRADRDAFLAMWDEEDKGGGGPVDGVERGPKSAKPAAALAPKKPAAAKPLAEEIDDQIDDDDDAGDDIDLDEVDDEEIETAADDDDEEAAPANAAGEQDPDLRKRLDQVRKQEKRNRDKLAADRKQFDTDRGSFERERDAFIAEWKPRIDAAHESEKRLANAKSDPVGLLVHAGVSEDDFEDISKMIYAMSPAAKADPKNRAAAAALKREREARQRTDALEAKYAALEAKLAKQETDSQHAKRVDAYVGKVASAIGDDTPLLKKGMEVAPQKTRAKLEKLAYKMAMKANSLEIDPKKVVRKYEKLRRAELEGDRAFAELLGTSDAKPAAAGGKKPATIQVGDRTRDKAPARPTTTNGKVAFPDRREMIERLRSGELDD